MATIPSAVRVGILHEYRLPDHDGRTPRRPLYVTDKLFDWIDVTEELYVEKWGRDTGGRSRFEHLMQMFADFICDERPLVGELNRLQPTSKGVWKMQPAGLRIYGWVPHNHAFVAVRAAFSERVHGRGSYKTTKQLISDVLAFAKRHQLEHTIQLGDRSALFPTIA